MSNIFIDAGYTEVTNRIHGTEYKINGKYVYSIPSKKPNVVISPDDKDLIPAHFDVHIFHSTALKFFPKRKNNGVSNINYGYKVEFENNTQLYEFLQYYKNLICLENKFFDDNVPFYKSFGINCELFKGKIIIEDYFSNKLYSILQKMNIYYLDDLLKLSINDIPQNYGFGTLCKEELYEVLFNIKNTQNLITEKSKDIQFNDFKEDIYCENHNEKEKFVELNCGKIIDNVESLSVENTVEPNSFEKEKIIEKDLEIIKKENSIEDTFNQSKSLDEYTPFFELFNINCEDFKRIEIDYSLFSNRLSKRLLSINLKYVSDLLILCINDLLSISGFGKSCKDEIFTYLSSLKNSPEDCINEDNVLDIERYLFSKHKEKILNKDYSFVEELNNKSKLCIDKIKNAQSDLDDELVTKCLLVEEETLKLYSCFKNYYKKYLLNKKYIGKVIKNNPNRIKNKIEYYIKAYTSDESVRGKLITISDSNSTIEEYIAYFVELKNCNYEQEINSFIKWLGFDIYESIKTFRELINDRTYNILLLRARKNTLENIGKQYDLSRERIRQIEVKAIKKTSLWLEKERIIQKIYAERDGDYVLTPEELSEYFRDDAEVFIYLLKLINIDEVIYDSNSDSFIIGDDSLVNRVQEFVDSFPETLNKEEMSIYIKKGSEVHSLSEELLLRTINENYSVTGDIYHRTRLTMSKIYSFILDKYYKEGIHIYDKENINSFKKHILDEFNIVLDASDRAIVGTISRICILCGRGTYRLNDREFISEALLNRIYDYIMAGDSPVYLTNTLFEVFENELISEGINNKYFLQGVLHYKLEDKLFFKRDYISRDVSYTNLYPAIIEFIKRYNYPISKNDIKKAFPGITDVVISFAVSDSSILIYHGLYYHVDHLKVSSNEKEYLKNCISKFILENGFVHCKKIFEFVNSDYPTLLMNNYIDYSYSMYSFLEYLFGGSYVFSRPFIAINEECLEKASNILFELVDNSDEIRVEDISSYARDNRIVINSIFDFINSCNKTHLLKNKDELIKIENTGINENVAKEIESIILADLNGTVPICELTCIGKFPIININWSDWLIFSVLHKWGEKVDVAISSNKFKNAIPYISLKGKLDKTLIEEDSNINSEIYVPDNLDDIDSLIENYILEDNDEL